MSILQMRRPRLRWLTLLAQSPTANQEQTIHSLVHHESILAAGQWPPLPSGQSCRCQSSRDKPGHVALLEMATAARKQDPGGHRTEGNGRRGEIASDTCLRTLNFHPSLPRMHQPVLQSFRPSSTDQQHPRLHCHLPVQATLTSCPDSHKSLQNSPPCS